MLPAVIACVCVCVCVIICSVHTCVYLHGSVLYLSVSLSAVVCVLACMQAHLCQILSMYCIYILLCMHLFVCVCAPCLASKQMEKGGGVVFKASPVFLVVGAQGLAFFLGQHSVARAAVMLKWSVEQENRLNSWDYKWHLNKCEIKSAITFWIWWEMLFKCSN